MALELTTREVGEVGAGIFAGSIIHVLVENFLDKYYKTAQRHLVVSVWESLLVRSHSLSIWSE